jgi:hypothetical protein
MKNIYKIITVALLGGLLVVWSCQSSSDDTKSEARAELEDRTETTLVTGEPIPTPTASEIDEPVGPLTTVRFEETRYDYGTVEQGEKVIYVFKFQNTGSEPLVLSDVRPSCGCTTPKWTREPVAPGEDGEIHVEFDTKGKSGQQTKTVTVTANTDPSKTVLTVAGEVLKPETDPS